MATYAIYGEVIFPAHRGRSNILVRRFSSLKIVKSWKMLTDTAIIIIARKNNAFHSNEVRKLLKSGDPVIIKMGYDGKLFTEFEGYIENIGTGSPIVITCEDEMYKLKRKTASISKQRCTLKELIEEIAKDYKIDCEDTQLGNVRYSNMAVTEILKDLQEKAGLYSFFREGTLVVGKTTLDSKPVKLVIEKQADESLKEKEIKEVWVKVESFQQHGKSLIFEIGDKGGTTLHIKQPNLTKIEIEKIGKELYEKSQQEGLTGDITLFGVPRLEHGMSVELRSNLYSERNGSFYIDGIEKSIAKDEGYRQKLELGQKAK